MHSHSLIVLILDFARDIHNAAYVFIHYYENISYFFS
jgi:hypothetical protein